jgi:hypothetical protein
VHDHPGLRKGERQEHAHGEEGDQRMGIPTEDDDQQSGQRGQHEHSVGIDQPIPKVLELVR